MYAVAHVVRKYGVLNRQCPIEINTVWLLWYYGIFGLTDIHKLHIFRDFIHSEVSETYLVNGYRFVALVQLLVVLAFLIQNWSDAIHDIRDTNHLPERMIALVGEFVYSLQQIL